MTTVTGAVVKSSVAQNGWFGPFSTFIKDPAGTPSPLGDEDVINVNAPFSFKVAGDVTITMKHEDMPSLRRIIFHGIVTALSESLDLTLVTSVDEMPSISPTEKRLTFLDGDIEFMMFWDEFKNDRARNRRLAEMDGISGATKSLKARVEKAMGAFDEIDPPYTPAQYQKMASTLRAAVENYRMPKPSVPESE